MPNSNSFNLNPINTQSPVQFKAQKFQREMASKGFLSIVLVLAFSVGSAFSARVIGFPPVPNQIPSGSVGPNQKHESQLFGYLHGFEEIKRLVPGGPNQEGHDAPPPLRPLEDSQPIIPSPLPPQHSEPLIPPPLPPQHSEPLIPPPLPPQHLHGFEEIKRLVPSGPNQEGHDSPPPALPSQHLHGFEEIKRLVPSGPNQEGHDAPPPPLSPQHLHGFEEIKRLVPSGPNHEGHDVPPPPRPPQHSQPIIPPPTAP